MLRQCVNLQPDGTALTFVDYDTDWDSVNETLTWYQLYRRMVNVSMELKRCASPGGYVNLKWPHRDGANWPHLKSSWSVWQAGAAVTSRVPCDPAGRGPLPLPVPTAR